MLHIQRAQRLPQRQCRPQVHTLGTADFARVTRHAIGTVNRVQHKIVRALGSLGAQLTLQRSQPFGMGLQATHDIGRFYAQRHAVLKQIQRVAALLLGRGGAAQQQTRHAAQARHIGNLLKQRQHGQVQQERCAQPLPASQGRAVRWPYCAERA